MRQETRTAITSVAVFGIQAVVAILLTRFLVKSLGVSQYAMVPLVNSFLPYLSIAAASIGAAAGRELTIARRSGSDKVAGEVFSTAVAVGGGLALVLMIGVALAAGPALTALRVPEALREGATFLMLAVGVAAGLSVVRSPLQAVSFSENRLDVDNLVVFSDAVLRAALIMLLFANLGPALVLVGAGTIASAAVALVLATVVALRLAPDLRPRMSEVRFERIRLLSHVGGWFMVGQIGALLFWSTDLFVLSVMTTATTVGLYGTVAVWPVFLRGLASAATSFLNPVLVRKFGSGDRAGVLEASLTAVRLLGLACAIPVGVIAGFAAPLLVVWLGPDFAKMAVVLAALTLPLGVNLAVVPLFGVNISYGKLAVPGTATLVAGVINIGLSVAWANSLPLGLGVALATAVALTTKNALFTPWYAARIQGAPKRAYYLALLPGTAGTAGVFGLSLAASRLPGTESVLGLMAYALAVVVMCAFALWKLILTDDDRGLFLTALRSAPESTTGGLD